MRKYLNLLQKVRNYGKPSKDRTGTGTRRIFAPNRDLRFDLRERFPVPTTKKFAQKACFGELIWFATGSDNIKDLKYFTFGDEHSPKKTIWCPNYAKQGAELGYTDGYCGDVYGVQWRNFGGKVDQLQNVVDKIINNPTDRRMVVYTTNPAAENTPILPPCHDFFQFFVDGDYVDLDFHMRSVDTFLGLPFNIASYAALLTIICKITNKIPRYVTCALGDTHIYSDHMDATYEQICRVPDEDQKTRLVIPEISSLDELQNWTAADFVLENYEPQSTIKAPMSA